MRLSATTRKYGNPDVLLSQEQINFCRKLNEKFIEEIENIPNQYPIKNFAKIDVYFMQGDGWAITVLRIDDELTKSLINDIFQDEILLGLIEIWEQLQ